MTAPEILEGVLTVTVVDAWRTFVVDAVEIVTDEDEDAPRESPPG